MWDVLILGVVHVGRVWKEAAHQGEDDEDNSNEEEEYYNKENINLSYSETYLSETISEASN